MFSNEPVEMVMEEETEPEKVDMAPKPTENVLALFEGPSYDVPMPSVSCRWVINLSSWHSPYSYRDSG